MPHYEIAGSTYFITFNTVEGLRLTDSAKDVVMASVKFHAARKYALHACVVMETHVHTVIRPLSVAEMPRTPYRAAQTYSLSQVCHSIKSYSAHKINSVLVRTGGVWQSESYDWVIRDEKDYRDKVTYIMWNPVRAGLVAKPEDYRWLFVEQ